MRESSFKDFKERAYKVMRLKDGRWGVLFKKGGDAKRYHWFLAKKGQEPTKITKTDYGWAYKFGISTETVMDLLPDDGVWPYSLVPPDYDKATQNMPKLGILYENKELEWRGFKPEQREVNLLKRTKLGTGSGISLRHIRVPFPADPSMTTGNDSIVNIWTVVSAGEPFSPTKQTTFIPYVLITWSLNLNTGKWISRQENDYHLLQDDDEFSKFLTTI